MLHRLTHALSDGLVGRLVRRLNGLYPLPHLAAIAVIIAARIVLESWLEQPHRPPNFVAQFHFPHFFLSIFVSVLLIIRLASGWSTRRIMNWLVPAFSLIALPPIVDAIVSGGEGYFLAYPIAPPGQVLRALPFLLRGIPGCSPGIRVETALALVTALFFMRFAARVSVLRAGFTSLAVYAAIAFHSLYPGFLMHWARQGVVLPRTMPVVVPPMETRLSLFLCLQLFVLLLLDRPSAVRTLGRHINLPVAVFYSIPPLLGAVFAWRSAPSLINNVRSFSRVGFDERVMPFDEIPVRLILLTLCSASAYWFAQVLNDWADSGADRINSKPNLFDPAGDQLRGTQTQTAPDPRLQRRAADHNLTAATTEPRVAELAPESGSPGRQLVWRSAVCAMLCSLLCALSVGVPWFLLTVLTLVLSVVYSLRPIRLKRIPLLSSVVLAAAWIAMFATGFSLLTDAHLRDNFPKSLFWLLLISLPLGLQVKDLKDVEGDCRVGVWTMPVLLGPVWGRIWCAVSAVVAFALPAFGLDRLPCVSLACAVFAGWAVLTQPPARAHRWLCGAAILLVLWVGVSGSVVTGR